VVTATRRSEALSKVPISVTALSQESLDARGMKDFQDIARFTPGRHDRQLGTNAISIRGISSSGGAGTTGIYIDDTPIQMRAWASIRTIRCPRLSIWIASRCCAARRARCSAPVPKAARCATSSPQPKLHGSSTYRAQRAGHTEGGQPSYELGVAHGAALIDGTLGVRASAWYRQDGGWIDRVDPTSRAVTERSANHNDIVYAAAGGGLAAERSSLTITPSIVYQKSNRHDESTYWPAYSNPSAGQFNNASPERLPVPDQYYLPALKLEWNLAHSQIISNTSLYSRNENRLPRHGL
jgi:iron complex outermembrane receptor protein